MSQKRPSRAPSVRSIVEDSAFDLGADLDDGPGNENDFANAGNDLGDALENSGDLGADLGAVGAARGGASLDAILGTDFALLGTDAGEGGTATVHTSTPFVRPRLVRRGSEAETRMLAMRERFGMLQLMEEAEKERERVEKEQRADLRGRSSSSGEFESKDDFPKLSSSSARWSKLRKVVNWPHNEDPFYSSRSLGLSRSPRASPIRSPRSPRSLSPRSPRLDPPRSSSRDASVKGSDLEAIELEDVQLLNFFSAEDVPEMEEKGEVPDLHLQTDAELFKSGIFTDLFNQDSKSLSVSVSAVPEAVVEQKKAEAAARVKEERLIMMEKIRAKEEDGRAREAVARAEVIRKEKEARGRLDAEKQKVLALELRGQRGLAQDFKRTREMLEKGIKEQSGAVRESFGHILLHEESLARRFQASSDYAPQPVEMRIHLLRAVKNKLPKGTYVLMLTQYDSLGGRPLSWSQIGANGIGNMRPGITRFCTHGGRYFDRALRVEDSCFALCPPRTLLQPNFVFVLELFHLADRFNPVDKIEAWTAIPMTYETMSIVEGKFKLPMMRGEHSPATQHFKNMEKDIAKNLDSWLCNVYLEVRHMSLNELGASEKMLKSQDFDLDYFNKTISPLDIYGKPIRPERVKVEEEMEELGRRANDGEVAAEARRLKEEGEMDQPAPFLPVDKGIFRRKMPTQGQGGLGHGSGQGPGVGMGQGKAVSFKKDLEEGGEGEGIGGVGMGMGVGAGEGVPGKLKVDSMAEDVDMEAGTGAGMGAGVDSKGAGGGKGAGIGAGAGAGAGAGDDAKHPPKTFMGFGGGNTITLAPQYAPILLKNDENFLEHRKLLVRKWKDNIHEKLGNGNSGSFMENGTSGAGTGLSGTGLSGAGASVEVLRERAYNIQNEVFLHHQQRGKVSAVETIRDKEGKQWASAGLEGRIVRRWQAEGPRFDSDAIGTEVEKDSPAVGKVWEDLRDLREMEDYNVSIAQDPSKKKGLVPGAKSASKVRYLHSELFGDFSHYLWGTFEFYLACLVYGFALWIRLYVHYVAQFLYLRALGTPVFGFELGVFQIIQKYMSTSISVSAEVGVVAIGPVANICLYIVMIGVGWLFFKFGGFLPEVVSKFFAAFGVATILDPALILLVDLCYGNYDCANYSAECAADYTAGDCDCFNGDSMKLWYRMEIEEGSGLTGVFIVLLLYTGTGLLAALLLYQYLIYVHRDGKILDQWRRVNGPNEQFFLPMDFEVSVDDLKAVVHKATHWRGPHGARRRLEVSVWTMQDSLDPDFGLPYKKFSIIEVEKGGVKSGFREFQLEPSGAIVELFDATKEYQARSIFATLDKEGEGSGSDGRAGVMSGRVPAGAGGESGGSNVGSGSVRSGGSGGSGGTGGEGSGRSKVSDEEGSARGGGGDSRRSGGGGSRRGSGSSRGRAYEHDDPQGNDEQVLEEELQGRRQDSGIF